MTRQPTPAQTVGPYFGLGLMNGTDVDNRLVRPDTNGEHIRVEGHVYDGDGDPLFNVLIELWQANAAGRYNHPLDDRPLPIEPAFTGFGRASTDIDGRYWFETVMPGAVEWEGGLQAPHMVLVVHASGVAHPLLTRLYFADDSRTGEDPVLQRVPEERRQTLLATREERDGGIVYRFDIVLRGQREDLVLESKVAAGDSSETAKASGKAETVFMALL
jgi:protocatechuate 3,4-dioxygenase alpha subunit